MCDQLNNTLLRIQQLCNDRNWSLYMLAKSCHIPFSSINTMFNRNTLPTLPTLEKICIGLNISLEEFFSADTAKGCDGFTREERDFLKRYRNLNDIDKELLTAYLDGLTRTRKRKGYVNS